MKEVVLFLTIVFTFFAQVKAQEAPNSLKVGELPIGNVITWVAAHTDKVFFVQRSDDGELFSTIGKIQPEDSIRHGMYSFLDVGLAPDEVFYRIAQANHTSGIQYSVIENICMNSPNELVLKRISNPEADKLVIVEFQSAKDADGHYDVTTDIQKQTFSVFTKDFKIFKGNNILPIRVQALDPGFYNVHLVMGQETEKFSFVKAPKNQEGDIIVVKK